MPRRMSTVVTTRSRPAVRAAIMGLRPRRGYYKLRRALMGFILQEVSERHAAAFDAKMMLGRDEFRRTWRRLSPVTIKKKGHNLIGYETGHMRDSFQPGHATATGNYIPGHKDQVAEIGPFSVKYGSRAAELRKGRRRPKTGFFHHGRKGQPAREFWRSRETARWVAAGIRKGIPRLMRLI